MKRLFLIFLAASFFLSAYSSYLIEANKEVRSWSSDKYSDFTIIIPRNDLLDSEVVLSLLEEAAIFHNVNLLRDVQLLGEGNDIAFTTFAFLTTKSPFLESIPIRTGSLLTIEETYEQSLILSSKKLEADMDEVKGTIQTLSRAHTREIRPLHQFPDYVSPFADYRVEQAGNTTSEKFSTTLADLFNSYFENHLDDYEPFIADDFTAQHVEVGSVNTTLDSSYIQALTWTFWGITSLMIMFYIMRRGKSVAIYSMHGFSLLRIWKQLIGNVAGASFVSYFLSFSLIVYILFGWQPNYLLAATVTGLIPFLILLLISFLFTFYISRSSLIDGLKNNTKTKLFLLTSQLAKVIALVSVIVSLLQIADRLFQVEEARSSMTDWTVSKDYGEFYPHYIGYDIDELEDGMGVSQTQVALTEELYPRLNADGAIYVDSFSYQEDVLIHDAQHNQDMIRSVRVNPNYLNVFDILDEQQQRVLVEEAETNRLLLVPKQFKERQEEITNYFEEKYEQLPLVEHYQSEQFSQLQDQEIRIIWLKSNQEVFSFNVDVFPEEGNLIIDPIIEVLTENNGYPIERDFFRGLIGTDPLKVKLIDQDTAKTYQHYLTLLRDLQLDDNAKNLVTINEQVQKDISEIHREIVLNVTLLLLTTAIALFMVVQTSHLLFIQHKKKFLLRRIFGHNLYRAYRNVLFWITITWVIIVSTIFYQYAGYSYIEKFVIVIVLFIAEVVVVLLVLIRLEKKNKVSILKGE
ncbi:DUF1430 domain-containing protein [Shouchella miscanthi]|uniref:DUF1430 domain-containing protein n=1 Tax=Shouchella miscanthi TaxID=2598861 RepID=A0ABU6NMW4_9BACI|nr:DUF1430 domain-containing protein [Shouchella miscanthi]